MKSAPAPAGDAERLRVLHELRLVDTEVDPAFAAIARLARQHTGWPIGAVSLVDAHRQWFAAAAGLDIRETPRDVAFCAHAILDAGALEVVDASSDERFANNPLVTDAPHARAYAAVPVRVDGQRIGTVCAIDRQPGRLDEAALAALHDLATLAGSLLQARLLEQRSRLQESRVRGASRAGSDWLWETDAQGVLTWVSDSVEAHTGQPAKADVGLSAQVLNQPRDDEHRASWDACLAAQAGQQSFRNAVADRNAAHGTITISMNGDPVFDSAGRFKGYRGAARNITEELTTRTQAQRTQDLLRASIECVAVGVMVSDAAGRIVLSNAAWRAGIHRFLQELPSRWSDLVQALLRAGAYPDAVGREAEFAAWRLGLTTAEGLQHELRFGTQHVLVTDQLLADGSVIHLSIDITPRRRAELELAEQQARLGAVLRSLPDLWFVIDADGRHVECSDEQHPGLLRPFAELRGKHFTEVVPEPLATQAMRAIGDALRSGDVQRIEYELSMPDGRVRHFEARISPMAGDRLLYLTRDLTELRGLERDVQLMQRALEAEAALPMVVADATQPDLPIIYANTAFERLSGLSRHQAIGRNCRFLQDGDRDQPGLATLRAALAAGRACTVTLRNRRADGEPFINELHVAPVRDSLGRVTHYVGVQHDVTERSRAARQLELSETLYRSVAASITDGLLVVGHDRRIVTANPSACALLGATASALTGQRLGRLGYRLLEEDGTLVGLDQHPVREVLRTGLSALDRVHRLRRPDGSERLLRLSVQPLRSDPDGSRVSCVVTFRDITAQRSAETALAQSEARWKFALEGAGDGIWDYDEDTQLVFYSPRWKAMLGHRDDEISTSTREWSRRIHPEDRPAVIDAIRRYRAGESGEYRTEHRLRHKDGHWIWVYERGKIVERRPDGSPRRIVGTHTDITRQKMADQALRDKRAAELASQAKSEFLSRMSHEMRTPLNAVIGFAQLLQKDSAGGTQRIAQFSGHILQAGEHLLALVNDVLDLQQVEEGRLSLRLEALALRAAVDNTLELVRPQAELRRITVLNRIDPDVRVWADAQRLRQVLLNLLSNAIKYNRDGGELRCAVTVDGPQRCVLVIEDTGTGLAASDLARLFQPFERLGRETSSTEGTGLGLVISRRLAEEMNGSLSLSSRPGHGTQVHLALPLPPALDPGETGSMPVEAERPSAGDANAPALRMLYVEDNRINAILFEEAIKLRGGFELRIAEDGPEALTMANEWQPDVLVLDANLPSTTGYEVLAELRGRPAFALTPAFMCSADAMPRDMQRALDAGFTGYWTKPIDIDRVMSDLDALRATAP
ncbi:PAS domain S-box protein [Methylibium sp.]|uniref:PAS domain S-box protein n=1 Tax=Methylibium sp. TaxID=2067992 RepID=UPI003D14C8BF